MYIKLVIPFYSSLFIFQCIHESFKRSTYIYNDYTFESLSDPDYSILKLHRKPSNDTDIFHYTIKLRNSVTQTIVDLTEMDQGELISKGYNRFMVRHDVNKYIQKTTKNSSFGEFNSKQPRASIQLSSTYQALCSSSTFETTLSRTKNIPKLDLPYLSSH